MDEFYPFDDLEGHEFEYYCADLLENRGFDQVTVTKGSGDYGIDIIAQRDGITYGIQCKRYEGSIGTKAVQEAFSGKAFYDCDEAVVLTNSYFTSQAIEAAEKLGVILWDRETLIELAADRKGPRRPYAEEDNKKRRLAGVLFGAVLVIAALVLFLIHRNGGVFLR